jgi:hypothetical protein
MTQHLLQALIGDGGDGAYHLLHQPRRWLERPVGRHPNVDGAAPPAGLTVLI